MINKLFVVILISFYKIVVMENKYYVKLFILSILQVKNGYFVQDL